ncbi:MAG: GNAT family N-acetyltransferase [Streptosporangiales bacterium]|nr:GNAT family N-acetyltransferase [Streptosporangiales bacterium]
MSGQAVRVVPATPDDAGPILTVQRAAYVTEAQAYGDPFISPLVESAEQIRKALADPATVAFRALLGTRLVGSVRGRVNDRTCLVGRLSVAPDLQGHGVGTVLLTALEREVAGRVDTLALFTGHQSSGNLRLYRRLGYTEASRERVAAHLVFVHLRKELGAVHA